MPRPTQQAGPSRGRPDFYLANLEHRHHEDFYQMDDTFLHMLTVWDETDRYTVHDVHFSRFHGVGVNTGLGNSSIMMLTKGDGGRNHVAVVNNTIKTPYDSGRTGAFTLWTNSPQASYGWTEETPVWLYRNSLSRQISYEGDALADMPDGTVIPERNVLDDGAWPQSERIVDTENLDEATYFDDQMRLTGEAREPYLGRYGAEIAVPDE